MKTDPRLFRAQAQTRGVIPSPVPRLSGRDVSATLAGNSCALLRPCAALHRHAGPVRDHVPATCGRHDELCRARPTVSSCRTFASPPVPHQAMSDVTRILNQVQQGDEKAARELLPLVYEELRKLAVVRMANEKAGQ